MKRFLILVGGFALSCCFVFSGCSNHSANTSDVDVAKGMGISSPDDIISSPVDPVKSAEEQPTIQPDFPKEEADKKKWQIINQQLQMMCVLSKHQILRRHPIVLSSQHFVHYGKRKEIRLLYLCPNKM